MKGQTKQAKKTPEETIQFATEVAELREQGYSCAEIGKRFGYDKSYIARIIKRYCPDLPRRYSNSKMKERIAQYKALVQAGKSSQEIADILGIGVKNVRQFLS